MGTSKSAISAVLRVTSVMRWILAVAARRPSITDSGRLALSRPPTARSIGRMCSPKALSTATSQFSIAVA